ncbi:methyl-accepting chemotaxis protein [Chitinimonas taiwanensis]|jgi:methyl-accepting chemotaxis protein|uniref:methyl-accepting chemotaxis protein n=1 Tax=Chitinimonas taiwanensis TaxID=240412 RepID=UPI0035B1CA19
MKNWKIGVRLGLGFGVVLILLIGMTVLSLSRMAAMADNLDEIGNERATQLRMANDIIDAVNMRVISLRDIILRTDEAGINQAKETNAKGRQAFDDNYKQLRDRVRSEEAKQYMAQIGQANDALRAGAGRLIELASKNENDAATQILYNELGPLQEKLTKVVNEFIVLQNERNKSTYEGAVASYESARNLMLVMAVLAILIGISAGWLITQSVVVPVRQAVQLAETVAAGDLTQKIETDRNDETGQLIKALKSMNDGLLQIVGDIRTSVETINTASQEIAAGNIDLSQRTEEQAASLEETAASMEELTSTVKQNAENAREANRVAESASHIAQKGGEAVGAVVTTMAEINESSKKIVDIIGVIDGIAFQTNILALNAAVEAARAGEQGRGFAVVAGEVRSLAQRSAAAAKEIKALIGDSVERVTVGTAQVDKAGVTMEEVVASIRKVTGIMGDISNASAEQSSGIEQVNTAVTQMDEVTQQNAALVEEAAAAAGSLQDQAHMLMEAVNRFKLDSAGQRRSPPPAARQVPRVASKPAGKPASKPAAHPVVAAKPANKGDDDDWSEF